MSKSFDKESYIEDSFTVKVKTLLELAIPAILSLFFAFSPEFVNVHMIGLYGT